ncbi:Phosphoglucosamine mutase [Haladaptatus paucihalophilus DX253]|uniref:Phosphoglucosamine mutase n=1 Tax=Haladaptatus paucihalophilus DX253 TaxID=797209 RepID=E7QXT5_HALPU|nr:phosphoglucosamine mutase [Haladaptatus paucihalophilus]EFW90636.1 Phosphoglucosamine mutase [Haladaptatus paucihalophilus DX253]SHL56647.1 phosphomannomutase / phosphoglucomutase [Haladaptatus paucihalophilus DX253]
MKVFGSSGTRGVANDELTPEFVLKIAKAAGTVWRTDRVALARDTRATGDMLADAAASGLASVGSDVDRLGVVPTPGAQAYAESEGVPALMITASHNPPEYNGVKLIGDDGIELAVGSLERVEEKFLTEKFEEVRWSETGHSHLIEDSRERYVSQLLESIDRDRIADANLTVALDPGHGAGSLTSPEFFRKLGCTVVTTNSQPDGHFPGRDPEPVPGNLADLGRLVEASGADVGIAHDGDADRAIFYDENGQYIEGDATLAALAAAQLEPDDAVVSAVNVSQRLVDVAHETGARLELTPIGSTNIITRIRELEDQGVSVPVAGEGNGGVFFPTYRLSRDGAYTAAKFLELLADERASAIVEPYNGYHNVRTNISYTTDAEQDALLAAAEREAEKSNAELNTRDGYRLDFGDAWVLARPSGTEPMVRIYAEARERHRSEELAEEMETALRAAKANV